MRQVRVSIRFEVRGAPRALPAHRRGSVSVSIRFEARGAPRAYPMTRRPDKPRCRVLTHHPPPHPLRAADRICPKWGKSPSQVAYTPEAVFGRSPTPLSEGVSKMPGRRELGVFVGFYLGWCRGLGWSFWGQVCRSAAGVVSTQPFASAHELAQPASKTFTTS